MMRKAACAAAFLVGTIWAGAAPATPLSWEFIAEGFDASDPTDRFRLSGRFGIDTTVADTEPYDNYGYYPGAGFIVIDEISGGPQEGQSGAWANMDVEIGDALGLTLFSPDGSQQSFLFLEFLDPISDTLPLRLSVSDLSDFSELSVYDRDVGIDTDSAQSYYIFAISRSNPRSRCAAGRPASNCPWP